MKKADMSMTELANAAFLKASEEVRRKARETGTPILVWEDGRIVRLSPDTLEPIEPAGQSVLPGSHEGAEQG